MSDTRELAAKRAYEVQALVMEGPWEELEEDSREYWCQVVDAVLATLDWHTDSAVTGRLDDMEERLRKLEKKRG